MRPDLRGLRPAWLVALLVGASAVWLLLDVRAAVRRQLEAAGIAADGQRQADDQRLAAAVSQAVDEAAARASEERAALEAQLAAERERLETATAERDLALAELTEVDGTAAALRARVSELEAEAVRLEEAQAGREDERLQLIGETARLVEQVLDRDRKLDVLNQSLGSLRAQADAEKAPSVVVTGRGEAGLPARLSEALHTGGAAHAAVLEARLADDGALADLLVRLTVDEQPPRLLTAKRAALAAARGRASLRLEGLGGDVADLVEPGEVLDTFDLDLPAFDAEAWAGLGLAVPAPFRAVSEVSSALAALLARLGWQLEGLEGVEGEMLLGLELSQVEPSGQVLRTLRAARATLGAGPELTLWDGTVTTAGDQRPFFGGLFRLPLPGLDAAAWKAALAPGAP